MGVRPPGNTSDTGSSMVEFGIPALAAHLDDADLSYPITARELVQELDDPAIPVNAQGRTVSLDQALRDVEQTEFATERDVLNALHPVFETYRSEGPTGIIGSLRAILPF